MSNQFQQLTIEVSQRVDGEFKKVGEVKIHTPLLSHIIPFVAQAEIKKDEKGNEVFEEGVPVYTTDEANWVQGAILAQVKSQARNKLVSKTADLKPGQKIAENWAELVAEGVRDGAGLALAREFKNAFGEWVSKQGLSDAAAKTLTTFIGNKAALELQTQGTKDKVKARLDAFAESLSPEALEKFMRPLESVMEMCKATESALDF